MRAPCKPAGKFLFLFSLTVCAKFLPPPPPFYQGLFSLPLESIAAQHSFRNLSEGAAAILKRQQWVR